MSAWSKGVPAMLAAGCILIGAGVHALLAHRARPLAPRLPTAGSILELRADDLGRRLDERGRFAIYRLLAPDALGDLGRITAGWDERLPVPGAVLGAGRATALALYPEGWLALVGGPPPAVARTRLRRLSAAWTIVGPESFPEPANSDAPSPEARRGVLHVTIPAPKGGAGLLRKLLPVEAEGTVVLERDRLRESWRIRCAGPCALDLLDAAWTGPAQAKGWSALPEDAESVAWLRLAPERLRHVEAALAAAPTVTRAIEAVEGFLGVPVREELARGLEGPVLLAVRAGPAPRLLAAFDLAAPIVMRTLVERVMAIGALSETVSIARYRGVTIGTWSSRSGSSPIEPAIAVDGEVLLLGSTRVEVEAALDRRRDPRRSPAIDAIRHRLDGAGGAVWRAWSRSRFTAEGWERLLDHSERRPAPEFEAAAFLRADAAGWIVEGGGSGPAAAADPLLPALRWGLNAAGGTRRLFD